MALPADVRTLLTALNEAGFAAFAVGGCVRDTLLGRTPHDWDITTAARPDDIAAVLTAAGAEVVGQVGEAFAVSVVRYGGESYEVATFRGETYGADSHRPERIYYADSLAEDLARRDFTVNAMAADADGRIYDPYDGRRYLRRRRLATVGRPEERFREDALRLFRACRFAAELDMVPTRELCAAMPQAFYRVRGLSLMRIKQETERLLVAPAVARGLDLLVRSGLASCTCRGRRDGRDFDVPLLPELAHLPDTPQQAEFHAYDAWMHTLVTVQHAPATLIGRWSALFHDAAKGLPDIRALRNGKLTDYGHDVRGAEMARDVLTRWGYPPALTERVAFLVGMHMRYHYFVQHDVADARKWLRKMARSGTFRTAAELREAMRQLYALCVADVVGCGRAHSHIDGHTAFAAYVDDILETMPVHTRDLHYADELPRMAGSRTGAVLKALLRRVQDGQLDNTPERLQEAAVRYLTRHTGEDRS